MVAGRCKSPWVLDSHVLSVSLFCVWKKKLFRILSWITIYMVMYQYDHRNTSEGGINSANALSHFKIICMMAKYDHCRYKKRSGGEIYFSISIPSRLSSRFFLPQLLALTSLWINFIWAVALIYNHHHFYSINSLSSYLRRVLNSLSKGRMILVGISLVNGQ